MLIEFYGKLPHKSEFLSPNSPSIPLQTLIDWISVGQAHIGESLLAHSNYTQNAYFFIISEPLIPTTIKGVFINSQDSKVRKYPFIIFHQSTNEDLSKIKSSYLKLLDELNFDISALNPQENNDTLIENYLLFLQNGLSTQNKSVWQSKNSHIPFVSEKLNQILYRKLVTGEIK